MAENVISFFDDVAKAFSGEISPLTTILFFTIVIIVYTLFVFVFSKFMARKNIFHFNLYQYNKSEHPFWVKFFSVSLYILEYLILVPLLSFLFFAVLSLLLLLLVNKLDVATALLICAAVVAAIRATSYVSHNMATDLAKLVPFNLLALALTQPEFFSIKVFFSRIAEIPSFLYVIPEYLLLIVSIEILMRGLEFLSGFIVSKSQ